MTRSSGSILAAFLLCVCWPGTGQAVGPEVAAGVVAANAAPKVLKGAASGLSSVPAAIGQTLLLPLGLAETVLSPLPVFTMRSGLSNVAKGIQGPFRLVGACLKAPLALLGAGG